MQEPVNNNRSELWSLSLRDLFYKYIRFLPLFILSAAIGLFIAYIYLRYATPIYNVSGTMLIKSETQAGRSDKFEDLFVNDKVLNIQSEIEVLKSKPLMERVVQRLGLQFNYYAIGKIKTPNIYKQSPFLIEGYEITDSSRTFSLKIKFVNDHEFYINDDKQVFSFGNLFKNANGVFRLVRIPIGPVSKDYSVEWKPTKTAASILAGGIQVTPKTPGTGILSISMETENSQMGADVINKLMEEYSVYSIEEKNAASDLILTFIAGRLKILGHELDSVQQVLLEYSQKENIIDIEAQSNAYFEDIKLNDKLINDQQLQLNVAGMVQEYLADKRNDFSQVPSSLGLADLTLNGLITEYNKAQFDRKELLDANVPMDNPAVKEKADRIEKLRQSLLENLKNIKTSFNSAISDLKKQTKLSKSQLEELPFKAKEYYEIKREVESKQALFKMLQEKREETAISRASTIASSKIIDRAVASTVPIKPNRKGIQILAILLGLGLPAMLIFIGEVLNDKVTTRFDIEKITPAPILGEVGHSYSNNSLIVTKTTRSMVAEQFRIIRSNLQYILHAKGEKSVILITSSFSGEGKSFISINMGAVLALASKKTIILEFDIRKPKILSELGITKGPGITNYLVGKANLEDLIKPVPGYDNLFILGCGPVPPNPAELLLDQRVEDLFTWMRQHFDVILVDTAPVGMVSDAMTLSKFADSTLYLVRQGYTFKKQVAMIDEFYQDNKLPKVSIIINDVKIKVGYGYYGYGRYGYGYGYGYGSYYEEEKPPKNIFEKVLSWMDIRKLFPKSGKR